MTHKQRIRRKKMLKQKVNGLIVVLISLATVPIDNDITFAVLGVPFGLYLMFTKEYWMY